MLSTKREDAQNSDLEPFFGDLSQIEKLCEIKPPLVDSFSWEFLDRTVYLPTLILEKRWNFIYLLFHDHLQNGSRKNTVLDFVIKLGIKLLIHLVLE